MAKERSAKKKKDAAGGAAAAAATPEAAAAAAAAAAAPYNGADNPWARWPHPRPDSYYAGPYNTYDWSHAAWPSHGDFGTYPPPPRAGYPFVNPMQQPMGPSSTPPAAGNSPNSSNPDSQSEASSFSDAAAAAEDPTGESKQSRKRTKPRASKGKQSAGGTAAAAAGTSAAVDENTAKNKRYGMEEVKDLVRFRTDLQSKFETMSTHLELWTSIGERMSDRGHPRRQWESYRDKWDIELRRYQKELKSLQQQQQPPPPPGESKDGEAAEQQQMVFADELLQEIHNRLTTRPKAALRSRFQSGVGGARGCLGEESGREVAGKRMKKSANNQLLVDSIVDKVVEKVGCFDDTASAQGFKEVLDAVVNLTNVLLADVSSAAAQQAGFSTELEIDDKVFTWLKSIGKEQYASHFAASHVDWTNLVLLDRDDLAEMKIPVGPRKFLLRELDKLRPPPGVVAETAAAVAAAAQEEQELLSLQTQLQEPEPEAV